MSELHDLHDDVRQTVRDLADTVHRAADRDDGGVTIHPEPSLLAQLREAVETGSENGKAGGRSSTRSPADLAALALLQQAERDAAAMHVQALAQDTVTPEERIRAVAGIVGRWTDPRAVATMLEQLRALKRAIRGLLDPQRHITVAAACPECGTRMVWRHQDGENVQTPALSMEHDRGCVCLHCGETWSTPQHLESLRRTIEYAERRDPPARVRSGAEGAAGPVESVDVSPDEE
ncbi:hypothetical protein H0B56_12185 [Haloechinothrix sp. YIM 98757]|uniref:Uncharacterized protein n=1 Tax=Haloechinothrix aidingensis TaxID=2752311 RepID=A0A838AAN6_9PSEU|nr:hypothetical protein [Haloechinothrix aidingensis]MBA0126301.1 hypothetical protein [Haloechinothrix aidingensis]